MLPFELKKALSALQANIDSHEKINLAYLTVKLQKAAEANPRDVTLGQMSQVVDRMNSGNRLFITRAELKSLYNDFYTTASNFAHYFSEELGIEKVAEETTSITETEFSPIDTYAGNDQAFAAELTSLFDPTATSYNKEAAKDAENVVAMECSYPGLVPTVKAVDGNGTEVIISASYITPKGVATISVPVEISGKRASGTPSYFRGKNGESHYLSRKSVANYIASSFDKIGSYDIGVQGYDLDIGQDKDAVDSFSLELETPKGIAQFEHGALVEAGRRVIANKMRQMGKRSAQVKVLDSSKNGITYGVGCNGIAFRVPVKVENGRLLEPSVILCKGSIEQFDAAGLASLQKERLTDSGVAAIVSPLFDVKPSELVETVREAAAEGNYIKAEDALNILSESGDEKAYQKAFTEYSAGLSGAKKEASVKSKCSRIIRNANSTQPICGHLNLPLHKVAQDKNGECITKHAKEVMDSNQGTLFMNSKVFL